MTAATTTAEARKPGPLDTLADTARKNGWTIGLLVFLGVLLAFTRFIQPTYGPSGIQNLAIQALPLALAAAAQAVVVIAGGIDLSIGSMMALTSVVAAANMEDQSPEYAVFVVIAVLVLGLVLGAINGTLIVATRIPDIVVTLAMGFVWAGAALLVLPTPGGGAPDWLKDLVLGSLGTEWLPKALVLLAIVVAIVWLPIQRSKIGLWLYANGSSPLAAFRSGVPVNRAKIIGYMVGGLFAALAGLSLTASTGIGTPVPGPTYTLLSVAAIVLGGVSLAGGRGGLFGPIVAVFILSLLRTDLSFLRINTNLSTVAQGIILVAVVMVGTLVQLRRERR
ncbi:MAG TPA: ABC transporter permease [Candidatus Limnocylindrales bacterium]|nr:ABC transporter permease [Candidatus Limnocylindrales bacterium]